MSHRLPHPDTTFVGLDVHKSSITSAVLVPSADVAVVDRFYPDEASIRRFLSGLGDPGLVSVCYEAGPTGYHLARLLRRLGASCEVIAPSLIPVTAGARVKTDRRDARRLVELHRVGQLTRSGSRPRPRRRSGICAGPGPTSSPTAPAPATGC